MTDVLNVSVRNELGSGPVRRLRRAGQIPAILYGHGEANVNLSIPTAEMKAALRHGSKLVDLQGGLNEKALIRIVQWDCYGIRRPAPGLDARQRAGAGRGHGVARIEGRGPGAKEGGIIDHHLFDVEIECPAGEIPDKLVASIKNLHLGQSLTLADVVLPPHVTLVTPHRYGRGQLPGSRPGRGTGRRGGSR